MSGDGAKIDKQAASNALAAWHSGAENLDSQFKSQASQTSAALDNGSWIGDDDAGTAFKGQFDVMAINAFLAPGSYSPDAKTQSKSGGAITGGVVYLGTSTKKAIEQSLAADEQQRQQMQAARKKASAATAASSSPSSSAPTSAGTSPTAGTSQASGTTAGASQASGTTPAASAENAAAHPDLFKGPLQWGIEGPDGKWHPLPKNADLKSNEYQGPLQWGIEGSDGKWYALPANERPTSTTDRGPLMHIMPTMATSVVVGHHGKATVNPETGQPQPEQKVQSAEMLSYLQPDKSSTTPQAHPAEMVSGPQPTPTTPQAHPAEMVSGPQPTPVEDNQKGGEPPVET